MTDLRTEGGKEGGADSDDIARSVHILDQFCFPFKRLVLMERAAEKLSKDYLANLTGPTMDTMRYEMVDSGDESFRSQFPKAVSSLSDSQGTVDTKPSRGSFAQWRRKRKVKDTSRWDVFPGLDETAFRLTHAKEGRQSNFSPPPRNRAGRGQATASSTRNEDILAKTFCLHDLEAAEELGQAEETDSDMDTVGTTPLTTSPLASTAYEEDSRRADDNSIQSSMHIKATNMLHVRSFKGVTFVNEYALMMSLGRGSFGEVKMALNTRDMEVYALKLIAKTRRRTISSRRNIAEAAVMSEINVMKKLSHPNIVRLVEVIDDPATNKLLMVLEYVEGGTLLGGMSIARKKRFLEIEARRYFCDILQGLSYLHANKVAHGDLKPDNFLLGTDGHAKIADFGSSQLTRVSDLVNRTAGTPAFMAPEMCSGEPYSAQSADIYALGASLYMLCFGTVPFRSNSILGLYREICESPLQFPSHIFVSDSLKHLLSGLLEKDPTERMSLLTAMRHPWVTYNEENPLLSPEEEANLKLPSTEFTEAAMLMESWPDEADQGLLSSLLRDIMPLSDSILFPNGSLLIELDDPFLGVYRIEQGQVEIISVNDVDVSDAEEEYQEQAEQGRTENALDLKMLIIMAEAACKASELSTASRETIGGEVKISALRGPGTYVGDLEAMQNGQEPCSRFIVRAKGDVTARSVSLHKYYNFIAKRPELEADGRIVLAQRRSELLLLKFVEGLASLKDELEAKLESWRRDSNSNVSC